MYKSGKNSLIEEEFKVFTSHYSKIYVIKSHEEILEKLIDAHILDHKNGIYSFRYKYIYYFNVAKYLSEKHSDDDCKDVLESLCKNIHTERNANILIFLVHHTKERRIIDEILVNTMCVYDSIPEATLDGKNLKFLTGLLESFPKLILEQRKVENERMKRLKEMDDFQNRIESQKIQTENIDDEKELFKDIVKSSRAIEIIGQILKNYHGSLKKDDLKDLATQAIKVGLRFLNFYLKTAESSKAELLEMLHGFIKNVYELSDEEIAKEAKKAFMALCSQISFAVIWKISNSLGEDKLTQIVEEIVSEAGNSPATKLIEIIVKLEYTKKFPKKEIVDLVGEIGESNPFSFRLLQYVLIQHLYLHRTNHSQRQWISDVLKVPIQKQLEIDNKKTQK